MKKMNMNEMRRVEGGGLGAIIAGWLIGRYIVCGTKGLFKC